MLITHPYSHRTHSSFNFINHFVINYATTERFKQQMIEKYFLAAWFTSIKVQKHS